MQNRTYTMYNAAGICGFVMHSWTALDISICIKTIATRFSMGWKIGSRYISKMNSNFSRKVNYSKSFDWLANIYLSSKMHTHPSIGIDTDIPLECLLFAFEKSDKQSSANRLNRIILNWRTFCKSTNSVYIDCVLKAKALNVAIYLYRRTKEQQLIPSILMNQPTYFNEWQIKLFAQLLVDHTKMSVTTKRMLVGEKCFHSNP